MSNKYVVFSLDDPSGKTRVLAGVLSNKTCKKIIDFLSDVNEASESEIANSIKAPLNTIGYNIKKLLETGLIEKTSRHFWSVKGKKIPTYKVSNKSIMISPKASSSANKALTSLITVIAAGIVGVFIKYLLRPAMLVTQKTNDFVYEAAPNIQAAGGSVAKDVALETSRNAAQSYLVINQVIPVWLWFLAGSLFALIIIMIINWKKI